MSRSYKKADYCGDRKNRGFKRVANHRVRQRLKRDLNYIPKPSEYKRLFESYDICDFWWLCSWESYWRRELAWYYYDRNNIYRKLDDTPPDYDEAYRNWYRYYKMK